MEDDFTLRERKQQERKAIENKKGREWKGVEDERGVCEWMEVVEIAEPCLQDIYRLAE